MGLDASVDLRALVREVLREAIAARAPTAVGPQSVTIRSDADLQSFLARLSAPGAIEAVRAGTLRFSLATAAPIAAAPLTATVLLDGVVSERKLQGIANGSVVKLAASAVLTPMAKDAARRHGLKLERIPE